MKPLFVDGTNLLIAQEELFGPTHYLSFSSLFQYLNTKFGIDKCYFYASFNPEPPKTDISRFAQYKRELAFFNNVKNEKSVQFKKGHRSPTSGKEKGVDVKLAVDITTLACENAYDEGYLVTGDADFEYAVQKVKEYGKEINLICLPTKIPFGIAHHVNKTNILDFNNYFATKVKPNIRGRIQSINRIDVTDQIEILEA